jgi:hypothetical protein
MAGTAKKVVLTSLRASEVRNLCVELNALIDDVEVLRAALATLSSAYNSHTHTGVTTGAGSTGATASTVDRSTYDAASDLVAAKLQTASGGTIDASYGT